MDTHFLNASRAELSDSLDLALVSRSFSRKCESLRSNSKCTVAYHDTRASGENGYVTLTGRVSEVPAHALPERKRLWKDRWSFFHPAVDAPDVVVWHFAPERLEIVSHNDMITDDWAPVTMTRGHGGTGRGAQSQWVLHPTGRRREEPGHRTCASSDSISQLGNALSGK